MSLKYRPEIDGLRALAILPVLFFHIDNNLLHGGFLGVDVFFVISGFLITSLLLSEIDQSVFSFKKFWIRRVKRIVPALSTMVLAVAIVALILLPKGDSHLIGWHGISALLSFANITMWQLADGYWGPVAANSLVLHCWSLSIEEQFYLLFPMLFFIVSKFYKRLLLPLGLAATLTSLLLFVYSTYFHPSIAFYMLPTRAWELASGTCLAIVIMKNREHWPAKHPLAARVIQFSALVLIIFSYIAIDGKNGSSLGTVFPVAGTTLLLWSTLGSKGFVVKFFTNRAIVFTGKISYSLYIWHWPVLSICNQIFYHVPLIAQVLIITGLAVGSYYFVELPLRKSKGGLGIIGGLVLVAISLLLYMMSKSQYYDVSMFSQTYWDGRRYDVTPGELDIPETGRLYGVKVFQQTDSQAFTKKGVIKNYCKTNKIPDIMVLGDSHALMWSSLIDTIAKELGLTVSFNGMDGTSPFFKIPSENITINGIKPEVKKIYDQQVLENITKWKPLIILATWWTNRTKDEPVDLMDFIHKNGIPVLLIEDPPELYFGHKNAMQNMVYRGILPDKNVKKYMDISKSIEYVSGEKIFQTVANKYDNCTVLHVKDIFLKGNQSWVLDGSDVLYTDGDHLSKTGSFKLHQRMRDKIVELFKNRRITNPHQNKADVGNDFVKK